MSYTVIGIFDSRSEAREAMSELVQKGFIEQDIDISEGRTNDTVQSSAAANTSGTTTDEGIGDSIGNFFSNLFSDNEAQARNYTNIAREADAILTVRADSRERAQEAAAIFDDHGAIDVDDRSSQYQQNYSQTSGGSARAANLTGSTETRMATDRATTGETVIPVVEEELQVGKRTVETGGVRVRSRVIEKPVEEHLRLREEHVVVNRRPVNRAVTDADMQNFREGDIEITERAEQAVVSKQARVVEEIEVGKQVEERDQVINDTVRRTDVDVEEINNTTDTNLNTDARRATK